MTITIDLWNIVYAATLLYSFVAMYLVFQTPHWPGGNTKKRGELLITLLLAFIPFMNVVAMTIMLAVTGKYTWLTTWMDSPIKPGTQDVTIDDPSVE